MAKKTKQHIPSITVDEIVLEGKNNTTTALINYDDDKFSVKDATGKSLLSVDSLSGEVSVANGLKLADGTVLNTVNDVNVQDFEVRVSSPVVVFKNEETPKDNEPVVFQAVLTNLSVNQATWTLNPAVDYAIDDINPNIIRIYPQSIVDTSITTIQITGEADGFSETIVLTKLFEGGDGISLVVTNPSDVLSADENGSVFESDLENTKGKFILYKGATNLTEGGLVAYSVDNAININLDIHESTGEYQVLGYTGADSSLRGGATLKALYDGVTYETEYSVTKAVKGAKGDKGDQGDAGLDGTSGQSPYLGLITDENVFINTINNNNVANISETAVGNPFIIESIEYYPLNDAIGQFTLLRGNEIVDIADIVFDLGLENSSQIEKNGLYFQINQDGSYRAFIKTRIVQSEDGWLEASDDESFTVRALVDGVVVSTKNIKIQKTKIGKDGKTGPSLKLSVRPQFFGFNGEGQPLESNQQLQVSIKPLNIDQYYGVGAWTYRIISDPEVSFGGTGLERTLSVENFKDSNGNYLSTSIITAQILVDGEVVLEDPVTIARTQNGASAKSIVLSSDSMVFTFNEKKPTGSEEDFITVTIKTQNIETGISPADISITKANGDAIPLTAQQLTVNPDENSYSFKLYLKSSNPEHVSLSLNTKQELAQFFPIKIQTSKEDVFDIININKLETEGGFSGYLTNEVDQIPASSDGETDIGDYSTLNGIFEVFLGTTKLTAADGVVFSVQEETDPEMDVIINSQTGEYYVSPDSINQGANTARRFLLAEYNEQIITKIFTVVKTKQGQNTVNAVLSNEAHTIRANSDGSLVSATRVADLQKAGGTIKVYEGNEDKTSVAEIKVLQGSESSEPAAAGEDNIGEYSSGGLKFILYSSGRYDVTTDTDSSWQSDSETFYIQIKQSNQTITKSYTITKSKGGADAKILTLQTNRQIFTFDSDNNESPAGQTITFTANLNNIDADVEWDAGSYTDILQTAAGEETNTRKRVISIADFKQRNLQSLSVTATADQIFSDTITIIKTKDGAAGAKAKTVKITSTSNVVLYPEKESEIPEQKTITVFIDGQNLDAAIDASKITITDKNSQNIPVFNSAADDGYTEGSILLVQDAIDSFDRYFVLNIKDGDEDTSFHLSKENFPIEIEVEAEGVSDIFTIQALNGGSNGINVLMSNESHVVPADPDGDVDENGLADAGGLLEIYEGINKITNPIGTIENVKFTIKAPEGKTVSESNLESSLELNGLIITVNQETGEYNLSENTDPSITWTSLSEVFELSAEYAGQSFTKKYSISKSKEGVAGTNGKDGKTVTLESDNYFVPYRENNSLISQFILTATPYNTAEGSTLTYEFLKGTNTVVDDDNYDIADNTLTVRDLPTPGETDTYFVNLYENGQQVAQDSVSIVATKEGSDAITVSIPNDNHTFTAEVDGTVLDNSDSGTKIQVLVGNTILNGVESTIENADMVPGTFKVTAVGTALVTPGGVIRTDPENPSDPNTKYNSLTMRPVNIDKAVSNGSITFTITVLKPNSSEPVVLTRTASYSKSIKGSDGLNARALFLLADSENFVINKAGNIVNSEISFSIIKENINSETVSFSVSPSTVELTNVNTTNGTAKLTFTNFGEEENVTVTVSATDTDETLFTDSVQIKKIESGKDGASGTNARSVKLVSTDYQIAYDEDGKNPDPATITLTATQQNHEGTVFYKFIQDGSEGENTESNQLEITLNADKFNTPITIQVETRESDENNNPIDPVLSTDSISIIATKDGANSVTISIPNDNHTFVSNEYGEISDNEYTAGATDIEVYIGNTRLQAADPNSPFSGNNQFKVQLISADNIELSNLSPSPDSTKYVLSGLNSMSSELNFATLTLSITVRGNTDTTQSYTRIISYSKSKAGPSAKLISLLPDNDNFLVDKEGVVINPVISFNLYKQNVTTDAQFESTPVGLLSYDLESGLPVLEYTNFGTNETVKVTATTTQRGETFTSETIIGKIESGKDGPQGIPGSDSKTVSLESDDYQIAYDTAGKNPETNAGNDYIILTASEQNHDSVVYKFYKKEASDSDFEEITKNQYNTSDTDTDSTRRFNLPTEKFNKPIRFKVESRDGSTTGNPTASDSISVIATKDGESAFNIVIDNDNHTFPADSDGIITTQHYALGLTNIEIYYGNKTLKAVNKPATDSLLGLEEFYVEKQDSNIQSTLIKKSDNTGYEITSLNNMNNNSATITLTVVARGPAGDPVSFTRYLSYSKSIEGQGGKDSKLLLLTSNYQNFNLDKNGDPLNNLITFYLTKQNIEPSVSFTTSPNVTLGTDANGNKTLSYANFGQNSLVSIDASVADSDGQNYTSTVIVGKTESGADGTDSKVVKLESDDYQISYDTSGRNPETNAGNNYITLTATEQNHDSVSYKFYKKEQNDNDFVLIAAQVGYAQNIRIFNLPNEKFDKPIRFKVETFENGSTTKSSSDSITIIATKDGESAFNIAIDNDNHTFPAESDGAVTSADYINGGTEIEVYYGNEKLEAVSEPANGATGLNPREFYIEKEDVNISSNFSTNDFSYVISLTNNSMSQDSASIKLTIVAKGPAGDAVTFNRFITYSKSKKGLDGGGLFSIEIDKSVFLIESNELGFLENFDISESQFTVKAYNGEVELEPLEGGSTEDGFYIIVEQPNYEEMTYNSQYSIDSVNKKITSGGITTWQHLSDYVELKVMIYCRYGNKQYEEERVIIFNKKVPTIVLDLERVSNLSQEIWSDTQGDLWNSYSPTSFKPRKSSLGWIAGHTTDGNLFSTTESTFDPNESSDIQEIDEQLTLSTGTDYTFDFIQLSDRANSIGQTVKFFNGEGNKDGSNVYNGYPFIANYGRTRTADGLDDIEFGEIHNFNHRLYYNGAYRPQGWVAVENSGNGQNLYKTYHLNNTTYTGKELIGSSETYFSHHNPAIWGYESSFTIPDDVLFGRIGRWQRQTGNTWHIFGDLIPIDTSKEYTFKFRGRHPSGNDATKKCTLRGYLIFFDQNREFINHNYYTSKIVGNGGTNGWRSSTTRLYGTEAVANSSRGFRSGYSKMPFNAKYAKLLVSIDFDAAGADNAIEIDYISLSESGTGPATALSENTADSWYLYSESSQRSYKYYTLVSEEFTASDKLYNIFLEYLTNGDSILTTDCVKFYIKQKYTENLSSNWLQVATFDKVSSDGWYISYALLQAYAGKTIQIKIVVQTGADQMSDLAIKKIGLSYFKRDDCPIVLNSNIASNYRNYKVRSVQQNEIGVLGNPKYGSYYSDVWSTVYNKDTSFPINSDGVATAYLASVPFPINHDKTYSLKTRLHYYTNQSINISIFTFSQDSDGYFRLVTQYVNTIENTAGYNRWIENNYFIHPYNELLDINRLKDGDSFSEFLNVSDSEDRNAWHSLQYGSLSPILPTHAVIVFSSTDAFYVDYAGFEESSAEYVVIGKPNEFVSQIKNEADTGKGLSISSGKNGTVTRTLISFSSNNGTGIGDITYYNGAVSYGNFTGFHPTIIEDFEFFENEDGEIVPSNYKYGDILSIVKTNPFLSGSNQPISYCTKTSKQKDKSVLGVYGSFIQEKKKDNNSYALSLGDGHVLVNSQNGNIEIGDYICSSDTPGIGMKQDSEVLLNYTVAKATESVDWSQEESDTKLISCTYHCG